MVKTDLEELQNVLILQNILALQLAELYSFTISFNNLKCSRTVHHNGFLLKILTMNVNLGKREH